MIVVMAPAAETGQVEQVIAWLVERGFDVHRSTGSERTVLGVVGPTATLDPAELALLPGVEEAVRVSTPYKLVSRAFHPEDTLVKVGGVAGAIPSRTVPANRPPISRHRPPSMRSS